MRSGKIALLLLAGTILSGQELRLGAGAFFLATNGGDLTVSWQAERSPWAFGFRYLHYQDHADLGGMVFDEIKHTVYGPTVAYLFRPGSNHDQGEFDLLAQIGMRFGPR